MLLNDSNFESFQYNCDVLRRVKLFFDLLVEDNSQNFNDTSTQYIGQIEAHLQELITSIHKCKSGIY